MDNAKLILYLSFGLVLFLLWGRWVEYSTPPAADIVQNDVNPAATNADPNAQRNPPARTRGDMPEAVASSAPAREAPARRASEGQKIIVTTDVMQVEIGSTGGDIDNLELLKIKADGDEDNAYRLLGSHPYYTIQSGLLHDRVRQMSDAALERRAPSHHAAFTANVPEVQLQPDQETVEVNLQWSNGAGVSVDKTYTFYRNQYYVDIQQTVRNLSAHEWVGRQYRQIRRQRPLDDSFNLLYTFTGGAYYDGKYNKLSFEEMEESNLALRTRGGWVAMLQHYFVSALLGDQEKDSDYYTRVVRANRSITGTEEFIIGLRSTPLRIGSGDTDTFTARVYSGPKLQNDLAVIAPGLELVTDYGVFSFLSKPLFWLLDGIHSLVGNWAAAIILLTILIKLVFYKLSETSYKSMGRMRKLQPSLLAMRERYKDDRQQLQKAMMEFYKKEQINPMGGCLPILVQIPVFIALYWVLLESVELRQAPFALWIHDLSRPDPFFVLPLIMGATMLIQTKLNPTPPDPMQAKLMLMMPVIFTAFFAFFPAGLVLYWVVNNILSIGQQWVINKRIEEQ